MTNNLALCFYTFFYTKKMDELQWMERYRSENKQNQILTCILRLFIVIFDTRGLQYF